MKHLILAASALSLAMAAPAKELPPSSPTDVSAVFMINKDKGFVKGQFKAPEQSESYTDPQPLTEPISKITVTRSCWQLGEFGTPVVEFTQAVPGKSYTFSDESIPSFGYDYTYDVKAVNAAGEGGYGASAYVFAGLRPAMPEFVSVTQADKGLPPVTFVISTPGISDTGEELASPLTALTLSYKDDDDDNETICEIETISAPVPGKEYTVTFDAAEGKSYTFLLVSSCAFGSSEAAGRKIFVGADSPGAPGEVTALTGADGSVTVTWTAPTAGRYNGWIDPAATRYRVERVAGENTVPVADAISDCSATDPCTDLTAPASVRYAVVAYNEFGESETAYSRNITVGPESRLPFVEHFNKKSGWSVEPENLWQFLPDNYDWAFTNFSYASGGFGGVLSDDDNDEGYAYCSQSLYSEADDRMISVPVDLREAEYPVVSFYYLTREGYDNRLAVACLQDGEEHELLDLGMADDVAAEGDAGWVLRSAPLDMAAGASASLVMRAYHSGEGELGSFCIDEILIDDYKPVKSFSADAADDVVTITWTAPAAFTAAPTEYAISIDGEEQPATLSAPEYVTTLSDDDNHTIAVRAIYGPISSCWSEPYTFNRHTTGVASAHGGAIRVEYFDLNGTGRSAVNPGDLLVRRTTHADGSVTFEKVLIRL